MTSSHIFSLDQNDYKGKIDARMEPFLTNWHLQEIYKNKVVNIPPDWDSSFHACKYFQVVKEKTDNNYNESQEENEIGLCMWGGWPGYDHEVEVNLFIFGKDVLSGKNKVSAEILKTGGALMILRWNHRTITDFRKKNWFGKTSISKVWIDDLTAYI